MSGNTQTNTEELDYANISDKSSTGSLASILCEKFLHSPQSDFAIVTEYPPEMTKGKRISKMNVVWIVLKSAIFLACLVICAYQSLGFYKRYLTYPLTTGITVINPEYYKVPAVTFCVRSPFRLREFCKNNPTFCEKPNDLEEFCGLYKHYCKGNGSNVLIPRTGFFTKRPTAEFNEFLLESYRNYSVTVYSPLIVDPKRMKNTKYTVVENPFETEVRKGKYMRCYSYNLHLMSNTEPEIIKNEADDGENLKILDFGIYTQLNDFFFAWSQDEVFLSVHSPFVPVNPLTEGYNLEPGSTYTVYVRLEEEHLLPNHYATECTDYEALWNKNKTGPRSQEMCKNNCYLSYTRKCFGCEKAKLMLNDPKNLCPDDLKEPRCEGTFNTEVEPCKRSCKPSCLKLKYHYQVTKIETSEKRIAKRNDIRVGVYVRDTDVRVLKHTPLYGAWEVFSYIGGLIGFWLSISVWKCFLITEKGFRKSAAVMQKRRNKSRLSSDGSSSLHMRNMN